MKTETGEVIQRGFTFEPDLLFDLDGSEFMADRLPDVLRERGYRRTRDFRWTRSLGAMSVHIDLFAPKAVDPESLPTPMTPLPDAQRVLRRAQRIELSVRGTRLRIAIPDAVGFLAMKVRAKLEQRPHETKDSFDLFTYVSWMGSKTVLEALQNAGREGRVLQKKLLGLFYTRSSPGVQDVLTFANTLDPSQRELLAQSVVDLFAEF